jgi:hypothetical protein
VVPQPVSNPSDQVAYRLPVRNPDFIGRADLLEALSQALGRGPAVVAAVQGLGGIGKTQLAACNAPTTSTTRLRPRPFVDGFD